MFYGHSTRYITHISRDWAQESSGSYYFGSPEKIEMFTQFDEKVEINV